MPSKSQWQGPIVVPTPRCETPGTEKSSSIYSRRREQVRRAQRNHRHRQKEYVKLMEDEVVRLQEEWSAVLREIQRASEENVVLKEILMLSLTHPTRPENGSRATTPPPGSIESPPHVEAATINPKDYFLPTTDHIEFASSTRKDVTTRPRSHLKAPAPMDCSRDGNAERPDFLPNISTSHQENHEYPEAQHEFTEEMDEATFSSFTTLSHGPMDRLNASHYDELGLSLHRNDFMFHEEEEHAYHGPGGHDQVDHRPEYPAYYHPAGLAPMAEPLTRTPSLTRLGYFDIEHSYSFQGGTGRCQAGLREWPSPAQPS